MKIAYYLEWSAGAESGVFKKVIAQTRCWYEQNPNIEICIFVLSHVDNYAEWQTAVHPQIELQFFQWQTRLGRFGQIRKMVHGLVQWQAEITYMRFGPYYPFFERIFRQSKLVLEVNTDDISEYAKRARHRYWYLRLTRARLLSQVTGMVFVSAEVAQRPHYAQFDKPTAIIPNGVDLTQYPLFSLPKNVDPHLVFIGDAKQPWSGVDKILKLAELRPDWQFSLIGVKDTDLEKDLPNVTAYGRLHKDDYLPILAKADIALGPLALYRKKMDSTSALKVAEYLACGIPIVLSYQETGFNGHEKPEWLLQIPNTENNIENAVEDIDKLIRKQLRVPREAIAHLDIQATEKQRWDFFKEVLDRD